ncbi:MAG: phosphatidate cytidylyltransferase, partial [Amoebophilaceae bacterium]|nr:phosphatidate cytidylyltransferase [Amoebophilaceae bacterium]
FYVVMLSMLEFYKLIKRIQITPMRIYGIGIGLLFYTISFAYYLHKNFSPMIWYSYVPLLILIYIAALYRQHSSNPFLDIAATLLGVLYIAIPFSMLHYLAFFTGKYAYRLTLGLLLITWAQDIGAYLVGSTIGKRSLFERISPRKTWEGFLGGALAAIITGYVVATYCSVIPLWQWLSIVCIVIIVGTYGDLVASLLKRSVDVKNSSNIIPGHGGFLDRVDSLLLTIPAVVAFLHLCGLFG